MPLEIGLIACAWFPANLVSHCQRSRALPSRERTDRLKISLRLKRPRGDEEEGGNHTE